MRLRIQLALLGGAGLLCAALLVEVGLRLGIPAGIPFVVQWGIGDDAVERRANQASRETYGSLTFDENGFRAGSRLPYDRTILFIGDSFTEGRGVSDDDTFARATERALRRTGIRVRSLNAGHRGLGAAQELKVLRRMIARFSVDAVVVQSFPMNDLSDNLAYGGFGIENGQLVEYETPQPPLRARVTGTLAQSWLRNLYLVRMAANALARGDEPAPYDAPNSFDLERALLSEMVSTVRAHGIAIVVLVIPTKLVQDVQRHTGALSRQQKMEIQRFERVRTLVEGFGVPWIDAGEVIPDLGADAAKSDGAHFSTAGNTLIGEALARQLEPLLQPRTGAAAGP